ncbi:DUF748 domain-containing protein [Mangrovimicrobium sediminis]|uniref:DUF748 domain-containing protein n=1 Tax=Mangrovimicrobium sediminis TaxID=2562682 RepID=A0A4Z0LXB2_9GAMM|nr:DUF748 domain-containing protein [Haliea sp. SAOS-164]TGD71919.1 DUF748 domain-containing protein [Haliea sp. SAOS-164]
MRLGDEVLGKIFKLLVGLYLTYLALVVLVVIPAANLLAPKLVRDYLHRELRTNAILVNPFTLAAEVRGARLLEPDGDQFLAFDKAAVNLSLGSLLGKGLVLDEVELRALRLDLRRLPDGSYNFSDMLPPAAEDAPEEPSTGELPRLTIGHLVLEAQRIDLTDEAREKPFTTHYNSIDINVRDLTTVVADGKPYRFDATGEDGGQLHWRGTISLPDARSEGTLALEGIKLDTGWRFAEPWLEFRVDDGEIHLRGDYTVSWGDAFDARISAGEFGLERLALTPKDAAALPDTAVRLRSLGITGISADVAEQSVHVDDILVDGLDVAGWSEGTRVSLVEMLAGPQGADPNQPATAAAGADDPNAPPAATPAATDDSGWRATIDSARLANAALRWRSEYTDPALLEVTPISASIRNINWPLQGEAPLELALRINDTTDFSLGGALELGTGAGEINYQLQGLPLPWFNPNLPDALHARIGDGTLGVDGSVALAQFQPTRVALDGGIEHFSGSIAGEEESLTSWDSVRWQGLDVNIAERHLKLNRLLIDNYQGRLHIAEDGSVNTSNVWREELEGSEVQAVAVEATKGPAWRVEVPEILLSDSAIDFKDESLPIPFRTVIGELHGQVTGIDSAPGASAQVDIRGTVDGYAPVSLVGSASPFEAPPALDLALAFDGVDMALLSPYSGTYAGRTIERGLLNLQLHYGLQDNRLKGDNKVLIDQLKLGAEVESDKAVDLPLDLALALLTDLNGVIDLQVPVEGDVNDPQFDIGSVVAKAFVNLITKAVTAPFKLLANLVGSEADLQRLAFPVGVTEVQPRAVEKLVTLADALRQRPQLTLVIYGRLNLAADRKRLQEQAFEAQLAEAGMAQADIESHGEKYIDAVDRRFAELDSGDGEALSYTQRYDRVLASFPVSDEALLLLAQARAVAVKEHLVNVEGLAADRAVIEQASTLDPEKEAFSGVELDLDG